MSSRASYLRHNVTTHGDLNPSDWAAWEARTRAKVVTHRIGMHLCSRRWSNAAKRNLLVVTMMAYFIAPAFAQEASGESAAPQGILEIVFAGGMVGVAIIVGLLALSMTSAYLVFEHLLTIRRQELIPEELQVQLRDLLSRGQVKETEAACQANPSFLSFVMLQGLAERDGGWPAVEKALEDALAEQAARLLRKIEYLSVIGNIAPMVGLLGTVTGMIFAFQEVAASQGAAGAGDLAEGIYQALVTTVGGLIVAIPSLAAFAILRNRVDHLVAEATYVVQHVARPLKRRLVRSPAAPPPQASSERGIS